MSPSVPQDSFFVTTLITCFTSKKDSAGGAQWDRDTLEPKLPDEKRKQIQIRLKNGNGTSLSCFCIMQTFFWGCQLSSNSYTFWNLSDLLNQKRVH